MINGKRSNIKEGIMFFRSKGIPIEDILEELAGTLELKIKKNYSFIELKDVTDELGTALFSRLNVSDMNNDVIIDHMSWLCELLIRYAIGKCKGETYRNVYDFVAKNYPKN